MAIGALANIKAADTNACASAEAAVWHPVGGLTDSKITCQIPGYKTRLVKHQPWNAADLHDSAMRQPQMLKVCA